MQQLRKRRKRGIFNIFFDKFGSGNIIGIDILDSAIDFFNEAGIGQILQIDDDRLDFGFIPEPIAPHYQISIFDMFPNELEINADILHEAFM